MAGLRAALVPLLIFIFLDTAYSQSEQCSDGWFYHAGSCYGFGQEAVTWANAESMCRLYEGSLAEIETTEENAFLKGLAQNNSLEAKGAWLGATDIFKEGHWVWVGSKRPLGEFTDWYPGQPDQSGYPGGEDCLQLYRDLNWQWNDEDCDQTAYFICEIRMEF